MYTKLCVLLLAIGMSQAVPQLVMPDVNLMQFMMQTRDLQGNPARSLECFDYYIPILNEYAETYKREFAQCLEVAEKARLDIDDTTVANRTEINNAASGACEALTECSELDIAVDFFQCYSNQGSSNSKTLYTISANASELLALVNQEYYLIELSAEACTNRSERTYIENNNAGIEELNKCVSGLAPVPQTSAAPESSSAAPESSSAEPESSSAAPESSSAEPESSSAAPESSSAAPESSSAEPESSSAAPESSSAAPESSSAEPESSSAAPESSSAAPESSSAAPESSSAEPESSSAEPESSSAEPESSSAAPESSSESPESSTTPDQRENLPEEDLSQRVAQEQAKLEQVLQSMRNWIHRQ